MSETEKRGLKIFLEFWLLIGVLAGFNFYMYYGSGKAMFLAVALLCIAGFIGWALFYLLYVRKAGK